MRVLTARRTTRALVRALGPDADVPGVCLKLKCCGLSCFMSLHTVRKETRLRVHACVCAQEEEEEEEEDEEGG